jgi:hypothetical protein
MGSGRVMDTLTSNLIFRDSLRDVLVYQGLTKAVPDAHYTRSKETLGLLRQVEFVTWQELDESTEVSDQSVVSKDKVILGIDIETISTL